MSGDLRLPAVNLDPVLSSACVGWEGFLLEGHDSITPRLVDAPEHFSGKHILRLNTGGGSMSNWRIDGRRQRTQDQPRAVSILPAGTHVSVVTHRTSCLVLEIDPLQLQQNAAPSASGDLELAVKLTIPDRNIELLMTAMQADLEAGSPTGPLYGESLGNALGIYLIQRFGGLPRSSNRTRAGCPSLV